MSRDVFEYRLDYGLYLIENLQGLFILVDKPHNDTVLAEIEQRFRDWVEQYQRQWSEDFADIIDFEDREITWWWKVVASLDEVSQIVANWPPQVEAIQAQGLVVGGWFIGYEVITIFRTRFWQELLNELSNTPNVQRFLLGSTPILC